MCPRLSDEHVQVRKVKKQLLMSVCKALLPHRTWAISLSRTAMPTIAQTQIPEFISFCLASHSVQQVPWFSLSKINAEGEVFLLFPLP